MKISKKSSLCAVLLLIIASNVAYSMDKPQKVGGWKKRAQWAVNIGEVALGLKSPVTLTTNPTPEFRDLPKDIQNIIIGLLMTGENADNLKDAANTINSLATLNTELNQLMNNPEYCLQLIKRLAKKYDVLDFQAAEALQIQASKDRLILQKKLATACKSGGTSKDINQLCQKEGADVNFTFPILKYPNNAITPLMIAAASERKSILKSLFENGADVNIANKDGETALIFAAAHGGPDTLEEFLNPICREKLQVNQQDKNGNTALMRNLKAPKITFEPRAIFFLLELGIDPELGNNAGLTPLQAAQDRGRQEVINLILNAINKKRG